MTEVQKIVNVKQPGARKVLVACNIPNGIVLRVCREEEYDEPVMGGGTRKAKQFSEEARFTVRGPAQPNGPDRNFDRPLVDKNGFALTPVDAELWEAFLAGQKNRKGEDTLPAIINGCLYAVSDSHDATKGDKAHAGVKSGLHPIEADDPNNMDPRMPRRLPNISVSAGSRAA